MQHKKILFTLIALGLVVAGGAGVYSLKETITSTSYTKAAQGVVASPTSTNTAFTLDQLAQHNSQEDCYIAYGGQVFNITWFIPRHEGGAQIVATCGTVTDDFSKIHQGGPFTKRAVQAVLQVSVVGKLAQE